MARKTATAKHKPSGTKKNGGKGHATASKAPRVRATAEEVDDAKRADLLRHHLDKLEPALVREKNAKGDVTKIYELAKKDGIPKKELQTAIKLKSDEGVQELQNDIDRILRISRWRGANIGTQFDMFNLTQGNADPIFEEGRNAAKRGEARKPAAHYSQKAAARWMDGWDKGNAARLAAIQEGLGEMASVGSVADKIVENAALAAGISQEPPAPAELQH